MVAYVAYVRMPRALPDTKLLPPLLAVPSAGFVGTGPGLNLMVPVLAVPGLAGATFMEPALGAASASATASLAARALALNARRCLQQAKQHSAAWLT